MDFMAYYLETINRRVLEEPKAFVRECDEKYDKNVIDASLKIADNIKRSRIVLLSGPSGSGKTTTAKNIEAALEKIGIVTHTVSLDDYFRDVSPETTPRDENGNYDFESPECLDIPLLTQHFLDLDMGREIMVPKFEFRNQKRNPTRARPLRLAENEIAIFEGIHALNEKITSHGEGRFATKVYISARSNIELNGRVVFKGTWMRITRRAVRDMKFRGASPAATFGMWESVRRGEKKYISPFKNSADIIFDSSLQYEVAVLKKYRDVLFSDIPKDTLRYEEIREMERAFDLFEQLDESYVPGTSLLREFIGDGIHQY
jgi:uridine kinase